MTRSFRRALSAAALTVALAACAAPPPAPAPSAASVTSCGRAQSFPTPPQRIVSLNQHATEILVALGLTDRIVGTAYPDTPDVPASIAADYKKIKLIAEKYPSMEQVLAAEPDVVVGGYASAFAEKDGRGREALERKGIRTLLLAESCSTGPIGITTYTEDLALFGKAFGVADRAKTLAAETTRRIDAVAAKVQGVEPVPVFFYDSGEKAAFTVGGHGLGNDLAKRAGGRNIFADLPKVFGDASWEQVAERAPKAVVLVDYLGAGGLDGKRAFLQGHPLVAKVPGVAQGKYVTLTLPDLIEGIRLADAVEKLARGLHPGVTW
ncbi:ABC transporter substrate-binding protein [Allokutzneria multivorans]|uniref:ABC transporter substrate-binding protein n=1 Tax=Allokutzneria multivorans TaxID=1142134 RepID=A0ABP7R6Y5_9PSEU